MNPWGKKISSAWIVFFFAVLFIRFSIHLFIFSVSTCSPRRCQTVASYAVDMGLPENAQVVWARWERIFINSQMLHYTIIYIVLRVEVPRNTRASDY